MGNHNSTSDSSIIFHDDMFKVDNINSYGRKHSSAKIQVLDDNLCIHQKNRESLFIPLNTIKRYGLDGSIFILECGRRAPLGPARYAFRCKQAQHLVDCLDERITAISNELMGENQDKLSLSLTTVSSNMNNLRQTRSDLSLTSATSFYRSSEQNLSENYFNFINSAELNYSEFATITSKSKSSLESQMKFDESVLHNQNHETTTAPLVSNTSKSYVSIDHEKTTTLQEIAKQRLQQHPERFDV